MPRKRPVEVRLSEAEEKVKELKDEKRMLELKERVTQRRRRRR